MTIVEGWPLEEVLLYVVVMATGLWRALSTLTKRDKFLFIRKYGVFSCTYVAALILENTFPVYKANLMRSVTLFF